MASAATKTEKSPLLIVYVMIGMVVPFCCIWYVLGNWRRERRFHRRWRLATLGGWLVPWVPNLGLAVDVGLPPYYETWLDPSENSFKYIGSIKPITVATTPTHPNSRTTLVHYPQPRPPIPARRLRGALLIPFTNPAIPSALDGPLPPRRVNLGMVPATVQTGVVILMPGSNQHSGPCQPNKVGAAKKGIAHGPDICIGVVIEEPRWLMD